MIILKGAWVLCENFKALVQPAFAERECFMSTELHGVSI